MAVLVFFVVHWYVSLFFQSFFHHRYAAHGICTMSPFWEKTFYVLCFITQGSSYISARTYGIMHRLHHAHTDTEEDPHSPQISGSALKMMLDTRNSYNGIHVGTIEVPDKYKQGLPDWPWFDKLVHNWYVRVLAGVGYLGIYTLIATEWWHYLFFPLSLMMGPLQGVGVNWAAHKFGYRNYNVKDTSTNLFPIDLIFWGEGYHNNHHRNPGRSNNAVRWFEVDMLFLAMRGMHALRIIKLKTVKQPAKLTYVPAKAAHTAPKDVPSLEEAIW
jgi:stearoyl-CoA desaturase (delta-9 desaturase)